MTAVSYSYRALDQDGKMTVGEIIAPNRDYVVQDLKKQGLIAVDVAEVKSGLLALLNKPVFETNTISNKELLGFTRELATLIEAGLTLVKSLSVLANMNNNKKTRKIIDRILLDIREGESFVGALKKEKGLFPKFYITMIGAGEASGKLGKVLTKLSDYLERSVEVREKTKSALVYPTILMVMVMLAMTLIITVVLPQFEPIFAQVEGELPWITELVMSFSTLVNENGWIILFFLILSIAGSVFAYRVPSLKLKAHHKMLSFFVIGNLIKKSEFARFHRMLGTLLENGLPLVPSFSIAVEGIHNRYIYNGIKDIFTRLKEGGNLSDQYFRAGFVPTLAMELTKVGEDTGRLSEMLIRTADIMDKDVRNLVDKFMALLVPLLTIVMGIIIAGMIASVLLGIMSVNEIAF